MKALKNHYANKKTVLMDILPLAKPMCFSIEPTNICNFKCSMCFHGNNEYAEDAKPLKNMDIECFEKIIKDLKEWDSPGRIKLIKLYSLGEPFICDYTCEMVRTIKEADVCDQIEITTNASLMTEEVARKLVDYGLDVLRVSVYGGTEEHMKEITKSAFTPEEILRNVEYLKKYRDDKGLNKPVIIAKMINTYSDENETFMKLYEHAADEVGIDEPYHLPNCEKDIFENLYHEKAQEAFEKSMETNLYNERRVCRYLFTHMTVRSDGTCVSCCADWLKDTRFGNVMEHSLKELWESRTLYENRCKMIDTKGLAFNACKNCEIPFRDMPEDNIDDSLKEKLLYSNEY